METSSYYLDEEPLHVPSKPLEEASAEAMRNIAETYGQLPGLVRSLSSSSIPKPKAVKDKNKQVRRKANKAASKARKRS